MSQPGRRESPARAADARLIAPYMISYEVVNELVVGFALAGSGLEEACGRWPASSSSSSFRLRPAGGR